MLIDLILAAEQTLVVGDGKEAEFKVAKLLDAKAMVTMLGGSFTDDLRKTASRKRGQVNLISARPTPAAVLRKIEEIDPRVVFISTGDLELDEDLSKAVRTTYGKAAPLICVVDEPWLNDFNMPAIARKGDIWVGVSTGGKSPAMAGALRRKIEGVITRQDMLQVRLQGHIRKASRKRLKDASSRREFAYKIMQDKTIATLLREEKYAAARKRAEKMLLEEEADVSLDRQARTAWHA